MGKHIIITVIYKNVWRY